MLSKNRNDGFKAMILITGIILVLLGLVEATSYLILSYAIFAIVLRTIRSQTSFLMALFFIICTAIFPFFSQGGFVEYLGVYAFYFFGIFLLQIIQELPSEEQKVIHR